MGYSVGMKCRGIPAVVALVLLVGCATHGRDAQPGGRVVPRRPSLVFTISSTRCPLRRRQPRSSSDRSRIWEGRDALADKVPGNWMRRSEVRGQKRWRGFSGKQRFGKHLCKWTRKGLTFDADCVKWSQVSWVRRRYLKRRLHTGRGFLEPAGNARQPWTPFG